MTLWRWERQAEEKTEKAQAGASNKKKCKEENRDARPKLKKGGL